MGAEARAYFEDLDKTVQGYLAHKNPLPLGPYSSPMSRDLW